MRKLIIGLILLVVLMSSVTPALAFYSKRKKIIFIDRAKYDQLANDYSQLKTTNDNLQTSNTDLLQKNQNWSTAYDNLKTQQEKSDDAFGKMMLQIVNKQITDSNQVISQYQSAYGQCRSYLATASSPVIVSQLPSINDTFRQMQQTQALQNISSALQSINNRQAVNQIIYGQ